MPNDQNKRLTKAEKRLSEIEKILRGHGSSEGGGTDYVSRGDWFPTDSDTLKERGNDHPHAVQRSQSK